MPGKKNGKPEPLPESFATPVEAGEFWDQHDLTDYLAQTRSAKPDIRLERRQFLLALEPSLATKLSKLAHERGISGEALANLWISERISDLEKRTK